MTGWLHLSMFCTLHSDTSNFRKHETRGKVIRHNPNVIYLNKLWMGLAKPGMALFMDSN